MILLSLRQILIVFKFLTSVNRALFLRHGIKCQTAATVLRLSEEHRINRIAFCQRMLEEWDDNRFRSIIFSDEKTFNTDVSWRTNVYRPKNTRYMPEFMKVKDKSGHITNNYWGAIGIDGPVTPLVSITGPLNSHKYMRIIRAHIVPVMQRFAANNEPKIFMQDNSPVHTAHNVMNFFSNQNFELMEWPPKSPDLNPIENVWSAMERGWPMIHPRNADNLHAVVQDRWQIVGQNQGMLLLYFISNNVNLIYHRWAKRIHTAMNVIDTY